MLQLLLQNGLGTVKKLPVLFLYFFTVPYAVCYNFTISLFFDNGLD
jgi:hypothetical protein